MTPWTPPPMYGPLERKYHEHCLEKSDIHEHLTVLRAMVWTGARVVELGVRWGKSTWALLSARPSVMHSIDIHRSGAVDEIERICREVGQDWRFSVCDSLKWVVQPHDILFIDSLHTYAHCLSELKRYAPHCTTLIGLHDTTTFGKRGEDGSEPGLEAAVNEFLDTDEGREWQVVLWRTNNNGLTVLQRSA